MFWLQIGKNSIDIISKILDMLYRKIFNCFLKLQKYIQATLLPGRLFFTSLSHILLVKASVLTLNRLGLILSRNFFLCTGSISPVN